MKVRPRAAKLLRRLANRVDPPRSVRVSFKGMDYVASMVLARQAVEEALNGDERPVYDRGGYIPGSTWVKLDPDECVIRGEDVRAGRRQCSRPGHPTATSDCA